jgi:hypothetical protein
MTTPSRAKAIAAARPMPESPLVTNALRPARRPDPYNCVGPWFGRGFIRLAGPGHGWDCRSRGGFGYLSFGSRKSGFSSLACDALATAGVVAAIARLAPPALPTSRREGGWLLFAVMLGSCRGANPTKTKPKAKNPALLLGASQSWCKRRKNAGHAGLDRLPLATGTATPPSFRRRRNCRRIRRASPRPSGC